MPVFFDLGPNGCPNILKAFPERGLTEIRPFITNDKEEKFNPGKIVKAMFSITLLYAVKTGGLFQKKIFSIERLNVQ